MTPSTSTRTAAAAPVALGERRPSPLREFARRLLRHRGAMIGLVVLLVIISISVFADFLAPYDPIQSSARESLDPPTAKHLFGADFLGRDILSRVIFGGRLSLPVGLISVSIASICGVTLGLLAGFYSGWIDSVTMRLMDLMLAFPGILLALAIVAVLGSGLINVMIAVGISAIPSYVRVVRGSVLSVKQNEFVEAARVIGCTDEIIIFRHILPNVLAPVIVLSTLGLAGAIIAGASLSYLGMGIKPPTPEWGSMLNQAREQLGTAWWAGFFPGVAIMLSVLAINLLGDGLRDILDPRLRNL